MKNYQLRISLLSILFLSANLLYAQGSGKALSLDGVNDYVNIGFPYGVDNHQDISYTFEAWVMLSNTSAKQVIIGNHNYEGTFGTALDVFNGEIRFFKKEEADMVAAPISTGWHHVAGTYDASSDEIVLYLDGVSQGTTPSVMNDAGGPHNIGTHSGNASIPLSNWYNGKVDEIRIWSRALSQDEIRHKMCETLSGSEPGLVAYYRMDEGADNTCSGGEDVCDASGNGNHGTKF